MGLLRGEFLEELSIGSMLHFSSLLLYLNVELLFFSGLTQALGVHGGPKDIAICSDNTGRYRALERMRAKSIRSCSHLGEKYSSCCRLCLLSCPVSFPVCNQWCKWCVLSLAGVIYNFSLLLDLVNPIYCVLGRNYFFLPESAYRAVCFEKPVLISVSHTTLRAWWCCGKRKSPSMYLGTKSDEPVSFLAEDHVLPPIFTGIRQLLTMQLIPLVSMGLYVSCSAWVVQSACYPRTRVTADLNKVFPDLPLGAESSPAFTTEITELWHHWLFSIKRFESEIGLLIVCLNKYDLCSPRTFKIIILLPQPLVKNVTSSPHSQWYVICA